MISDSQYIGMIFTFLKPVLITGAITAVSSICIAYAVYFYNKSRNVKEKFSTYELIFLFGIIGAVVYLISSRKKEPNFEYAVDKKKQKIISVILAVICVVATGINLVGLPRDAIYDDDYLDTINGLSMGFYDRYGTSYSNSNDVVYYTNDGYKFKLTTDSNGNAIYSQLTSSYDGKYKEEYQPYLTYIDKEGYIVFTDRELEFDDSVDGAFCYFDSNNEYYACPINVYWDADGNLCEY